MGLARALIRAPAFVTRSATDTSSRVAANRRGPRRAPGGPPRAVFFNIWYEKYARKSLSNVIYTFLTTNSGFPDLETASGCLGALKYRDTS